MDSLSSSLTSFDDINIICPIHDLTSIGVCGDYFCKERRFFCMKCINQTDTCIVSNKHELVSLSELLYRFFIKQENKAIDLVEINTMMEALKEIDRMEITKNLSDFTKSCQINIDKCLDDFHKNLKTRLDQCKIDSLSQVEQLNNKFKSVNSNYEQISELTKYSNDIPDCLVNFSPTSIKDFLKSTDIKYLEKENVVRLLKFFANYDKITKIMTSVDDTLHLAKTVSQETIDILGSKIDNHLSMIEQKIFKKIDELEKILIPPKDNIVVYKSTSQKFNSDPTNLILKNDICETAHKSNSIDSVFTSFKSLKSEYFVVWGTPSYNVEVYDLKLEKIVKTISAAHTSTIFSCRHYLDKKSKSDLVVTSSYDRSVKVWSAKDWTCTVNIQNAHTGYYIYSVCILSDEIENKNFIISAAPNEYTKIWDFTGKYLREFGVSNESTYFISSWYDSKNKKYYMINANSVDVKVYEFKSGLLFKSFKGTPQTWHMSAIINETSSITQLIESDGNGNVRIWDFYLGTMIKLIAPGTSSGVNLRGICLWNDNYLFAAGSDYNVRLYDIKNGTFLKSFTSHTSTVCALDKIVHPKYGDCLISHGLDGKLKLWTLK
jgi:WD40 repeat protein